MISRNDCLLLLTDIANKGIETTDILNELINGQDVSLNVLKFINDNRELEVSQFYEHIRKSYNKKKSNLYINIMKEIEEPTKVLTTLSSMLTQILLYSNKAKDRQMFLRHARAVDISTVLNNYFKTYDLTLCLKLMRLIKIDIKALESIKEK